MLTVPKDRELDGAEPLGPDRHAIELGHEVEGPVVGRPGRPHLPMVGEEAALERRARERGPGHPERHLVGSWMPALARSIIARISASVGRRRTSRSLRMRSAYSGQAASSVVRAGASASMGARRYTQAMGAVETMEDFFEKLNAGDREGAVALMDEMTEMRVHVGDSVQMLRGVERVGGWFLRGDKGLRMIPGGIRDTGNTYEADLLVVRPGAPTQHIDATFRVEAGKITAINIAPR